MTDPNRRSALKLLALCAFPASLVAQQGQGYRFEIVRDGRSGFRWRLRSGNNQTIATAGEAFTTRANCRAAVELVKRVSGGAPIQDLT
jgi:uncharacterized protein YegP (UPF0339 family)